MDTLDAASGFQQGLAIQAVAGFHNYLTTIVAVAPGITTAADLAGKQIVLGGPADLAAFKRYAALLSQAGWDIQSVTPPPTVADIDPASTLQQLLDGQIAMAPILDGDRRAVLDAGGTLIFDDQIYGSDVVVAGSDLVSTDPNTVQAFLTAYIRALQDVTDPANDDYIFGLAAANGISVADDVKAGWASDINEFDSWDGGFGQSAQGAGLAELRSYLASNLQPVPELGAFIARKALNAAQEALGLADDPTTAPPPSASPDVSLPSTVPASPAEAGSASPSAQP